MTATVSKTSSIRKGLTAIVLSGALAASMIAGSTSAQAYQMIPYHYYHQHHHHHHGYWGPGLGVGIGLGLLGAAIADSGPTCYWQREYNRYGDYVGRVQVCE